MSKLAIACALLGGCTVKEKTEMGPTISVSLDGSFNSVSDQDTDPHLFIDTTGTSNDITVQVNATDGSSMEGSSSSTSAATSLTATFAIPGVTIPDSPFTRVDDFGVTFMRRDPIALTSADVGKMLTVHFAAVDGDGLHSNVIDFAIALQMF